MTEASVLKGSHGIIILLRDGEDRKIQWKSLLLHQETTCTWDEFSERVKTVPSQVVSQFNYLKIDDNSEREEEKFSTFQPTTRHSTHIYPTNNLEDQQST